MSYIDEVDRKEIPNGTVILVENRKPSMPAIQHKYELKVFIKKYNAWFDSRALGNRVINGDSCDGIFSEMPEEDDFAIRLGVISHPENVNVFTDIVQDELVAKITG